MVTGETLVDSQKSLINNDTLLNEKLKEDFEENVSIGTCRCDHLV